MPAGPTSFFAEMRVLLMVAAAMALILVLIAVVSPTAAIAASPGVIVGAVAMLTFGGFRPVVWTLLVLGALTWIAFLIGPNAWASAVLMALVGLVMGLAGRVGLRSIAMIVAMFTASALIPQPPPIGDLGTVAGATSTAAVILLAGLASAVVLRVMAPGRTFHRPPVVPWPETVVNTTALVVTLFLGTLWVLTWDRSPVAAWLMVTIIVIAQPSSSVTLWRSAERVIGTAVGAVLAAGVVVLVPFQWLEFVVAFVLLVSAWSLRLSHPIMETGHFYWMYALLWTPAMVILTVPQGGSATLSADGQRVLLTVVAAIGVALVTAAARMAVRPSLRHPESSQPGVGPT